MINRLKKPFICLLALFIICTSVFLSACGNMMTGDFLMRSKSPEYTYLLEAYREGGGSADKNTVKVYCTEGESKSKTLVYTKYGEDEVEIKWQDDKVVTINGTTLDLSKNEKYDSNKDK